MENETKKWRPENINTDFMGELDSAWKPDDDWNGVNPSRPNERYYRTGEMKTPSGIPYTYRAQQHTYHRNKPPREMALALPDAFLGFGDYSQDELADFMEMYENKNPFYESMKNGGMGMYAPYQDTPEYNAWLQQFRDYAKNKYGITDEDEHRFYDSLGYGIPLNKDYSLFDDEEDSMGRRAANYFDAMRYLSKMPELFGRKIK